MIGAVLRVLTRAALRLRYRIRVRGLEEVAARGREGILFLPNHPSLIDPVMVIGELHRAFRPQALVGPDPIEAPGVGWVSRKLGALPLPTHEAGAGEDHTLEDFIDALRLGGNGVLYPSGRPMRSRFEALGGAGAVEAILAEVPEARVVFLRTRGLWGSTFSHSAGEAPDARKAFLKGLGYLLAGFFFFLPRREVYLEALEPDDLPRDLGGGALAQRLEAFYNEPAQPALYVPHHFWTRGGRRKLRDAAPARREEEGKAATNLVPGELMPVGSRWFQASHLPMAVPEGETIPSVFLRQAARGPGRAVLADQSGGVRTYRDLVLSILVLKPILEALPGEYVGIMLPAAAGSATLFLAALFAGKTPVMLNWTGGVRNMILGLDQLKVRTVITSAQLVAKVEGQGTDLSELKPRFLLVEDVRPRIPLRAKLRAFLQSHASWADLERATVRDTAVILFTSGSENHPKVVPLTHGNLLTNVRDIVEVYPFRPEDSIVGFLPPFHAFGLTTTVLLPLCAGIRTVYHPNPTEGRALARLIEAYHVTMLVGTPTFLAGIVRVAKGSELASLGKVISGAEKCPDSLFQTLERRWPGMTLLEGYGITECSPVVCWNRVDAPRRGSIGPPLPSVEHAIVDLETGERCELRRTGLLLVKGPSVFNGYLGYDGPSPFMAFEGESWYRTGDLAREESDGSLVFAGRLMRFVKLGGEMVSLPAVEEALLRRFSHEEDEEIVLAVEATDEEINPDLVLFTIRGVSREAANAAIREAGLSPIHHVRVVHHVEKIPVLGTGKTDYRAVKALLAP